MADIWFSAMSIGNVYKVHVLVYVQKAVVVCITIVENVLIFLGSKHGTNRNKDII